MLYMPKPHRIIISFGCKSMSIIGKANRQDRTCLSFKIDYRATCLVDIPYKNLFRARNKSGTVFSPRKVQDMICMATEFKNFLCFSIPKKNPIILSSRC
jgi:hypothetical protein